MNLTIAPGDAFLVELGVSGAEVDRAQLPGGLAYGGGTLHRGRWIGVATTPDRRHRRVRRDRPAPAETGSGGSRLGQRRSGGLVLQVPSRAVACRSTGREREFLYPQNFACYGHYAPNAV
jgi:hypothetical protein